MWNFLSGTMGVEKSITESKKELDKVKMYRSIAL